MVMKRKLILAEILIATGVVYLLLSSPAHAEDDRKLKIVTTIGPITDAVRIIGKGRVLVKGLIGPGVNPHEYRANRSDVEALTEADLVFYCGLNLESYMMPMFNHLKESKATIPLGESVPVDMRLDIANYNSHYDAHIWFDVSLWQKVIEEVALSLAEHDPEYEDYYLEQAANYNAQLDQLNEYVSKRAQAIPEEERVLVTTHDAFRYFGRKYGFEVISLEKISADSQAEKTNIAELADFIIKRKIRTIFAETSVSEKNIRAVQDAARFRAWDIKVGAALFSDALDEDDKFEGTYIGMITYLIDSLADSLQNPK